MERVRQVMVMAAVVMVMKALERVMNLIRYSRTAGSKCICVVV
jgi:hypothetical protein